MRSNNEAANGQLLQKIRKQVCSKAPTFRPNIRCYSSAFVTSVPPSADMAREKLRSSRLGMGYCEWKDDAYKDDASTSSTRTAKDSKM